MGSILRVGAAVREVATPAASDDTSDGGSPRRHH
jgi:hypothetical protein